MLEVGEPGVVGDVLDCELGIVGDDWGADAVEIGAGRLNERVWLLLEHRCATRLHHTMDHDEDVVSRQAPHDSHQCRRDAGYGPKRSA